MTLWYHAHIFKIYKIKKVLGYVIKDYVADAITTISFKTLCLKKHAICQM